MVANIRRLKTLSSLLLLTKKGAKTKKMSMLQYGTISAGINGILLSQLKTATE